MFRDALGWASSFVLLLTIGRQIYKQWKENTSTGVSKWLFVGQLASNAGFVAYSVLVANWVFVVTNAALFAGNLLGLAITLRHRRRGARRGGSS